MLKNKEVRYSNFKILNVELSSLGSHKLSLSIQDFHHRIIMEASNKLKPVTELTCAQFSIGIFIVLFSFAGIFYIIGELTIHFPLYLAFLTPTIFFFFSFLYRSPIFSSLPPRIVCRSQNSNSSSDGMEIDWPYCRSI